MSKQLSVATISVASAEQDQIRQVINATKDPQVSWEWSADAARSDVVIIDADSMYGHMDWLRAQAQGRNVICLTAASGHEQDNVLHRPIGAGTIRAALIRAAQRAGINLPDPGQAVEAAPARSEPVTPVAPMPPQTAALRPRTDPNQVAVPASPLPPPAAPVRPRTDPNQRAVPATPVTPAAVNPTPAPAAAPATRSSIQPPNLLRAATPAPAASVPTATPAPAAAAPAPAPTPAPAPVPAETRVVSLTLADYCVSDNMARAAKIERPGLPPLVIDAAQDRYYAGLTLKPLLGYCQGEIALTEWKSLTDAETEKFRSSNSGLPLSRLLWLYVLGTSNGLNVLPGLDISAKFKLSKWPQIEREFPKHFRIATAMMKGFAPLQEVADAAGASLGDVVDFVNAYAAIGFVQQETGSFNADRKAVLDRLRQRAG